MSHRFADKSEDKELLGLAKTTHNRENLAMDKNNFHDELLVAGVKARERIVEHT